jgi:hypothetical protein
LRDARWPRIAGLRVVGSWPETGYSRPPQAVGPGARLIALAAVVLVMGGLVAIGVAFASQIHAPQPKATAAGSVAAAAHGPTLQHSEPVSVSIPAIGVNSTLLHLGLNADGSVQVPSVTTDAGQAAWYKYSATPGQVGASVIEGHVDSYHGPAVFFRLGALVPGDLINVRLADGVTAVFRVSGVREYSKTNFPAKTIYGATNYAALRLITCGGVFDYATRHYLSSTVVFASLVSSRAA